MATEAVWITTKKFSERKKERIQKFYEKRGRPQGKLVLFEIKVWMKEYENIREGCWNFFILLCLCFNFGKNFGSDVNWEILLIKGKY